MIKHILVTGASSGIGHAIAERLITTEIVGVQYNTNFEGVKDFLYAKYKCDFLDYEGGLIKDFLYDYGKIDALINCVGTISDIPFDELTAGEFDRVVRINSRAAFLLSKEAFNAMKKRGGKIINISSFCVKYGMGRNKTIQYAASKAMIDTLTVGLARMGAQHNILVNAVSPGVIDTPIQDNSKVSRIPLGRMGTVEDIANIVEYLISDKGNFITGEVIRVAGGE